MFPKGMFSCALQTSLTTPEWWPITKEKLAHVSHSKSLSKFCEFLASLHSCPGTSASIER